MDWTPNEAQQVQRAIAVNPGRRWERRQFPLSPRGLTSDALQDFRSLPFEGGRNLDVQDADFSRATSIRNQYGVDTGLSLWAWRCLRVRFDGAGVVHRIDGIFDKCSFDAIKSDGCAMVGLFRDCSFKQANLKRATLVSNFVRCRFERAQLDVCSWGSSFEECEFIECKISPVFRDVADFVAGGKPVTFSVLTSGRVRSGETAAYFARPDLLTGWPP